MQQIFTMMEYSKYLIQLYRINKSIICLSILLHVNLKGRAFTSKIVYDGKLYIITGNAKRVYKQIEANPRVEILAYQMKNQEYMRVDATAVISDDTVIKEAYLEKEPQVRGDFEGDAVPQMGLFFLKDASVEILTLDGMVKEAFHFNG